jgi:stress-induced morphogen
MVPADVVRSTLEAALPGAVVEVEDLTGTSDHFSATVRAPQFSGKSRIEQHQLVYAALGNLMAGPIHALALKTAPLE